VEVLEARLQDSDKELAIVSFDHMDIVLSKVFKLAVKGIQVSSSR